jgi:hypothetical protein
MTTATITRDDLEGKLREIEGAVDEAARDWSKLIIGGAVVAAVVVIGWRIYRSRTQRITVEVYTRP